MAQTSPPISCLPFKTGSLALLKNARAIAAHTMVILVVLMTTRPLYAQPSEPASPPHWPELTPEAHAKMIEQLKTLSKKTTEQVNRSLRLLETKYFLFYTDLPSAEARKWARLLDKMYNRLCNLFGIEKGTNVWHGKALIIVFAQKKDYQKFWRTMLDVDPGWSDGMCHSSSDGKVIIAFYRQPDEMDFATILVHESVHGFLHRYRSPVHIISWVNEGLAEVIAYELVPKSRQIPLKQRNARSEMIERGGIGKDFFTADQIEPWQYGVASGLTTFMIKQRKKGYVAFINGIKDGMSWQESLTTNYGVALERLIQFYGKSIGIKKPLVP